VRQIAATRCGSMREYPRGVLGCHVITSIYGTAASTNCHKLAYGGLRYAVYIYHVTKNTADRACSLRGKCDISRL
jgi:hypothetical protein